MASSDQPPQSSVGKPAAVLQNATEWLSSEQAAPSVEKPDDRAAEIAKLEAMMQHIATQLAELKNTSSVGKPATTELDHSASMDPLPTTSVEKPGDVLPRLLPSFESEAATGNKDLNNSEGSASKPAKEKDSAVQSFDTSVDEERASSAILTERRIEQSVNTSGDEQVSFYERLRTTSVEKPGIAQRPLSPPLPRGDTLATSSGQAHPIPQPPPLPPAAPQLIKLKGKKDIQQAIFHPLRAAVTGEFPNFQLPTFLATDQGDHIALDDLQHTFEINWRTVARFKSAVFENLHVESWTVQFYEDEPDPTPPEYPDRPRLDAVLTFSDGTWARWHPSGEPIFSTQPMPTAAMVIRFNRKRILFKHLQARQR